MTVRKLLLPLLCAALLLTGCGTKPEERIIAWRDSLNGNSFRFEADVTALEEERTWRFSADVESRGGETALRITEPEEIAGITLRSGERDTLEYDGAVLVLPDVTGDGVTPAAALPLLCTALRSGRLLRCADTREGGMTAELREDESKTWVVKWDGNMTPLSAELTENGQTILYCNIRAFSPEG